MNLGPVEPPEYSLTFWDSCLLCLAACQDFFCVLCLLDVCRVIELLDRLQRSGELPPPKLQALQRVLQSKFCAAIREVRTYSRVLGEVWGQKKFSKTQHSASALCTFTWKKGKAEIHLTDLFHFLSLSSNGICSVVIT